MKRLFLAFAIIYVLTFSAGAEDSTDANPLAASTDSLLSAVPLDGANSPQLAMSTPAYPVTAGDIYTLAYAAGSVPVSFTILVDPSYKIRVSNLAVLDARGKTFLELKREVETVVSKNYPLSGVQFAITSPAAFQVVIRGEVKQTTEKKAWALSRLSSVLSNQLTAFSSTRDIKVTGTDGNVQKCDLFLAERNGDLYQDPYLRPGDTISVGKFKRAVTITGAVERPGKYQLLEGDTLTDLINRYGNGFTPFADRNRIELVRYVGEPDSNGKKFLLKEKDAASGFKLMNQDSVVVSAVTDLLPVLFVEGAIGAAADATPEAATRVPVRFNPGENLASIVRKNRGWFTPVSDIKNAYLTRSGKRIPVDLNPMLYDASYVSEIFVLDNDTLVVPFRQYFVSVSGAVVKPGRYPYIPDRDWSYYIALAGGFDPNRNTGEDVDITDLSGKKLLKNDSITPETIIEAKSNALGATVSLLAAAPIEGAHSPQLAMSNPHYLVTPGDVYTLAYAAGNVPVSYSILIDPSCQIRIANLAMFDAKTKTFLDLKREVEAVVSKNYPFTGVQFALTSPASFQVTVRGEVKRTTEKSAWALSRLSSSVGDLLTDYSSTRDVTVTDADGNARVFDLFRAERNGDLSQDPYLRPGDTISVGRLERAVTISGSVERPGKYQLLEGETLSDLLDRYAAGFTPLADRTRIELVRYVGETDTSGRKFFLKEKDVASGFALQNLDNITVSAVTDLLPVLFIEGSVGAEAGATPEASTRLPVRFNPGENLASIVRKNRGWFTPVSDTKNAYLVRGGKRIPVDLNPMLYDAMYFSEVFVLDNDTLVVPFRQYFVSVSGAVATPGRYPYIPDRNWNYYIALAGGLDPTRNTNETVNITDLNGRRLSKSDSITPETIIEAKSNSFLYYFNHYAPVITTVLSLITTSITLYTLSN